MTHGLHATSCIEYDLRTISVNCDSANFTDLYETLNNSTLIGKESSKTWILNANLTIQNGSSFYINSTDVDWLKVTSTANHSHKIESRGNLIIDSVKITGWDTAKKDYPLTDKEGNAPRGYIIIKRGTGDTNITNSEIGYLGYHRGESFGLTYYTGGGSLLKNNKIHDLYYGFYSDNHVGGLTIENNQFYNNTVYGIDPHSGTHDMLIKNNKVYQNGKHGIICSTDCHNIHIESNKVFDNANEGIMLFQNVSNSTINNNVLYGNREQIVLHVFSNNNTVHNNTVTGGKVGIRVNTGSSSNLIYDNIIRNSDYGIYVLQGASNNVIDSNIITSALKSAIHVQDNNTKNNIFKDNLLLDNHNGIKYSNTTKKEAAFFNNTVGNTTNVQ